MKSLKLLAAGVLAAACISSATAANLGTVYVTGSSAFRAATISSIQALYDSGTLQTGCVGSPLSSSTYAIFKGTLSSTSDAVTICTDFTGSAAGVQAIVQTTTGGVSSGAANIVGVLFIDPATTLTGSATTGLSTPTYKHAAGIALSDVNFVLTPFTRPTDLVPTEYSGGPVGVIPFFWVKNNGASSSITNLTNQIVKGLAAGGLPLSFFTGTDTDTAKVRIVGRNGDSGTRLTAYEESGYGALTNPQQFAPQGAVQGPGDGTGESAGGGPIASFTKWQAETINGISFPIGAGGFSSGGLLATVMGRTSTAGPIIAYLGKSDAVTAVGLGATVLSYNGVTPEAPSSTLFPSITEGLYSFWSYEHLYYNTQSNAATIGELLGAEIQIPAQAQLSGVDIISMNVNRGAEGQVILHN